MIALLLAGCAASNFSPTPTWPADAYGTAVAYHSTVISEAYQTATAIRMSHAYIPHINSGSCQSYEAVVEILPDKTSLAVNETLKVSVTLHNIGCSGLGLPYFQIQPRRSEILAYASPEIQNHYRSVVPGEEDTAEFLFTASASGQVELVAQADFEVGLDAAPSTNGTPVPTPAWMWKQVLSTPVTITVK